MSNSQYGLPLLDGLAARQLGRSERCAVDHRNTAALSLVDKVRLPNFRDSV
jgi:hypothetical protein